MPVSQATLTPEQAARLKTLRAELRAVKEDMKELGIRRISCFNGGLSNVQWRYNAECFRLESEIKEIQGKKY